MFKKTLLTTALILGSIGVANAIEASNTTCSSTDGKVKTYLKASHFDAWYFKTMYAVVKDANGAWHESDPQEVTISQSVDFTFTVKYDT